MQTTRYMHKPLFVAAVQVTTANMIEVAAWCKGEIVDAGVIRENGASGAFIRVPIVRAANARHTQAFVGDSVVYTDLGEFKIYSKKAFKALFVPALTGKDGEHPEGCCVEGHRHPKVVKTDGEAAEG